LRLMSCIIVTPGGIGRPSGIRCAIAAGPHRDASLRRAPGAHVVLRVLRTV
jgi:hypothetical protein